LATEIGLVTQRRKVIVHIATSADGYIARSDGDALPRSEPTLMTLHPTRTERSLVLVPCNIAVKLMNARTASTFRIAPALRVRSFTRAFDGPSRCS